MYKYTTQLRELFKAWKLYGNLSVKNGNLYENKVCLVATSEIDCPDNTVNNKYIKICLF